MILNQLDAIVKQVSLENNKNVTVQDLGVKANFFSEVWSRLEPELEPDNLKDFHLQ